MYFTKRTGEGYFRREEAYLVAIAALAAMLIAASTEGRSGQTSLFGLYAYWLIRIFIEALLFVSIRDAVEIHLSGHRAPLIATAISIVVSHLPFVLAITAFDIVLGYPELGLETAASMQASKFAEFAMELVYLFDNHLALCLLLTVPKLLIARLTLQMSAATVDAMPVDEPSQSPSLLAGIEPPLSGDIIWAEAQEHYVRLTTSQETRMVLYRFSDILRDLPEDAGIQVHRSHWVAFAAIAEAFKDGPNMRLRLTTGAIVPVSRSFRQATDQAVRRFHSAPDD